MGVEKAAMWAAKYFLNPEVRCQSRSAGDHVHVGYEAHPEDTGSSGYRSGPTSSFRQQAHFLELLSSTGEPLAEVELPYFDKELVAVRTQEVTAELYAVAIREQFRKFIPGTEPDVSLPEYSEKELLSGKNWGGRETPFDYEVCLVDGPSGRYCEVRFHFAGEKGVHTKRLSPDNFRQNTKQTSCLTACWKGSKVTLVMSKDKAKSLFNDMDWDWPGSW